MNEREKQAAPGNTEAAAGNEVVLNGTLSSPTSIPQPGDLSSLPDGRLVFPSTTDGPPIRWAVIDALHSFERELVRRGLVQFGPELDAAFLAAWSKMQGASYFEVVCDD